MVKKMIAMLVALMVMSGVAMSAFADGDVTDVQSPAETVEQVVGETPDVENGLQSQDGDVVDTVDNEEVETLQDEETLPDEETSQDGEALADGETSQGEETSSDEETSTVEETPIVDEIQIDDTTENVETQVEAPVEYMIVYRYFDGNEEKEVTEMVLSTDRIEEPDFTPVMEGHTFLFWYNVDLSQNENLEIEAFAFNEAPTAHIVLQPYFEMNIVETPVEDIPSNDEEMYVEDETVYTDESADTTTDENNDVYHTDVAELPAFMKVIDNPENQDTNSNNDGIVLLDDETTDSNDGIVLLDDETTDNNDGIVLLDDETTDSNDGIVLLDDETTDSNDGIVLLDGEDVNEGQVMDSGVAGIIILDDEDDEDDDIVTMEEQEVPLAGPTATNSRTILLSSNHGACMNMGDIITVRATLSGYDGYQVELQWEYNDGNGWQNAENGTELEYSFAADSNTINYDWRIAVTVVGEIAA